MYLQRVSPWLAKSSTATRTSAREPDDIRTYLAEPPIPTQVLEMLATSPSGSGVMKYWYLQWEKTPALAQMGSDFCSMPATSVDVERAFSEGRREIGFMQHNMSAQTFRAEMALGSWDGQPFFPNWKELGKFLSKENA
ncbi:HAT family dimerization protein [Mycena kentingensis (nom. inval.)]|nr:HAT family dimerization protein [Mycena kentingensis (nom. inval.)]